LTFYSQNKVKRMQYSHQKHFFVARYCYYSILSQRQKGSRKYLSSSKREEIARSSEFPYERRDDDRLFLTYFFFDASTSAHVSPRRLKTTIFTRSQTRCRAFERLFDCRRSEHNNRLLLSLAQVKMNILQWSYSKRFCEKKCEKKIAKYCTNSFLSAFAVSILSILSISISMMSCALRFCRVSTCYDALFEP